MEHRIGFLGVGNGITDKKFDGKALVPFAHGVGLISDDVFEALSGLNIYNIVQPCFQEPLSQQDGNLNSSLPASFQQLGRLGNHSSEKKNFRPSLVSPD
ncbi:serine carboxypeptidase 1-like [Mangifera indica]|uniref:serine carboxypeptidase 1-like n=1 Tax=Mangifera indica TaxID=29780 RepID=UPI001CF9E7CD|nr:serine carboxypeptidase 1-like [Mangifera indica]